MRRATVAVTLHSRGGCTAWPRRPRRGHVKSRVHGSNIKRHRDRRPGPDRRRAPAHRSPTQSRWAPTIAEGGGSRLGPCWRCWGCRGWGHRGARSTSTLPGGPASRAESTLQRTVSGIPPTAGLEDTGGTPRAGVGGASRRSSYRCETSASPSPCPCVRPSMTRQLARRAGHISTSPSPCWTYRPPPPRHDTAPSPPRAQTGLYEPDQKQGASLPPVTEILHLHLQQYPRRPFHPVCWFVEEPTFSLPAVIWCRNPT
ncbi:hypothetical protein DFH27DRAFT_358795 [Peziza echinospora]|nr:hypothetical protein DFH27DRAFT_358795 [Peziza echinospora]